MRLRFYARPVRLLGDGAVAGVVVERTAVDPADRLTSTRETDVLPADLVVAAIGYQGHDLPGLEVAGGTVPHEGGRVLRDGVVSPGEYVAGWIKRGPTGVVGTNKHDARETVAALLADAPTLLRVEGPDLVATLRARGCRPVLLENWRAIDDAEHALGATRGRARTTIHDRGTLRTTAHPVPRSVISGCRASSGAPAARGRAVALRPSGSRRGPGLVSRSCGGPWPRR